MANQPDMLQLIEDLLLLNLDNPIDTPQKNMD